ncbi:MAG: Rpn family recombination-promoting nuclease/putative transposase, partial [Gammaproteobacteria bacterium]|nr:Rpn family recombination-promoting nuclease/putative transposase [Gammaproteobacteria bacterium]
MALESKNPHDGLFHEVLGETQHAISYMQAILPQEITARLDTTEAEQCSDHYVNKKFRGFETDVLYKIKLAGKPAFAYFLLEHQST